MICFGTAGKLVGGCRFAIPTVSLLTVFVLYGNFDTLTGNSQWNWWLPPVGATWSESTMSGRGVEYGYIADSLVDYGEFGNALGVTSGSTAWMPPLWCWLQAGVQYAGLPRRCVGPACYWGQLIMLATMMTMLAKRVLQSRRKTEVYVLLASMTICVGLHFSYTIQSSHDCIFIATLLGMVVLLDDADILQSRRFGPAVWGLLGGVCALGSPTAGFAWAVLTVSKCRRVGLSAVMLAAVTSALCVAPWCVRNWVVLNALVPIKSNLGYELYQAQLLSPNGLVNAYSSQMHPVRNPTSRQKYIREGEIAFVSSAKQKFFDDVRKRPIVYLQKVLNRTDAAFFSYTTYYNTTRPRLIRIFEQALHLVPTVCLLFVIGTWSSQTRIARSSAILWIAFLAPYLLSSYYERYAVPLIFLQFVIVCTVLSEAIARVGAWVGSCGDEQRKARFDAS